MNTGGLCSISKFGLTAVYCLVLVQWIEGIIPLQCKKKVGVNLQKVNTLLYRQSAILYGHFDDYGINV